MSKNDEQKESPKHKQFYIRDRPFNLHGGAIVFFSLRNYFFGQHES